MAARRARTSASSWLPSRSSVLKSARRSLRVRVSFLLPRSSWASSVSREEMVRESADSPSAAPRTSSGVFSKVSETAWKLLASFSESISSKVRPSPVNAWVTS